MIEIKKLELDETRRLIVISDIHGNLELFQKLLQKVNFTERDCLIINGDLCEKGNNSLKVVDYVRKRVESENNIFITKGNCDVVFRYVFNGNEGIRAYMKNRKNSILNEMLTTYDRSIEEFPNLENLADYYLTHFKDTIDWLESLPLAYEFGEYLVIHAGVEIGKELTETDEDYALYAKAFHEAGHDTEKTVIVGHWPVANYRANLVSSHTPLIDEERRIISIDGGNQIKRSGQLNALIIENGACTYTFVDELEKVVRIQKDHIDSTNRLGTVTYPNYEISPLEQGEHFTICENTNLGVKQWIKNEYIVEEEGQYFSRDDLSTTFLSVKEGELVKIIDDECTGYTQIKKENGDIGWIPNYCFHK